MRCEKCGRLSPDEVNVCKFCGNIFDETKPAEEIVPNNQLVYEIGDAKKDGEAPKYFKYGWLIIAAGIAVVALIILKISGII